MIRLSGGRVESLDADLVIGRNPAREKLEPHQRAVVHGEGDRTCLAAPHTAQAQRFGR